MSWRPLGNLLLIGLLASAAAAHAQAPSSPAERFGPLYAEVEMRRLFPDSKTFADAVPKGPAARIMAAYRAHHRFTDAELRRFILARFAVPQVEAPSPPPSQAPSASLKAHIAALWPILARPPLAPPPGGSALALSHPYVVPGGRFREMYYWDSYFTALGLAADGRKDLVLGLTADFGDLVERYGHIPNGTRSYYLTRSQPPVFYLLADLADSLDPAGAPKRLAQVRREYAFWMAGEHEAAPGQAVRRVVRLSDGALLNRYADDADTPRDESFREDVLTAKASGRPVKEVYRDLRAAAESGWDFSSRWLADPKALASVRTTSIAPVDLNSLLFGMESWIARRCGETGDRSCAAEFAGRAERRKAAMAAHLWDPARGAFLDYDWRQGRRSDIVSAASLYPLYVGLADQAQAAAAAQLVRRELLGPGGLRTTAIPSGQQWDSPNGWAPLQWIAVRGLAAYAQKDLADEIAGRWLATVCRTYRASGKLVEKYDVESAAPGGGGEYPLQDGFGWTNGVVRALLEGRPEPC